MSGRHITNIENDVPSAYVFGAISCMKATVARIKKWI